MKFEMTKKKMATLGLLAALTFGFAAPAFAASFTNVTLGPWWEDVSIVSGTKYSGSGTALISVSSSSKNGGNFWITKDGNQCSYSVDVHVNQSKGSSYHNSGTSGTVVLHGHQYGYGSGTDYVTGSVNFNN